MFHRATAFAAALGLTQIIVTGASAESAWGNYEDLSPNDGDGMLCEMATAWSDGREFSVWVNGNNYFGFSLIDKRWTLPKTLNSHVTFDFGRGRENTFPIEAVSTEHAIGNWEQGDAMQFLERFVELWELRIVFPQGESWRVDLTGTARAANAWADCYQRMSARSGAPRSSDPFGGGSVGTSNPF